MVKIPAALSPPPSVTVYPQFDKDSTYRRAPSQSSYAAESAESVSAAKTKLSNPGGLTLPFPYKSAIFPMQERPRLEDWLKAKDQPGSRYLVIVHPFDSEQASVKLAQDRGDAVTAAIHQLLPPKHLDRVSVLDSFSRRVEVAIVPADEGSNVGTQPASSSQHPSKHPTSAPPLARPPVPVVEIPYGEGSPEK